MTALRRGLQEAVDELKKEVIEMANTVIKNINDSIKAFADNNIDLAKEIILRDDVVDRYEEEISKRALKIIWKEQPLAGDLRLVTGILKLITDLERIGDHAIDIAEITINTANLKSERVIPTTVKMAEIAKKMVLDSVEALFKTNIELANKVIAVDDEVDKLFQKIIKRIVKELKEETIDPDLSVYLLMVAKYIERIGDHAVNICEWIIFIVSGNHKSTPLF
ncbi:phosphate signaling complex protein PhoU [Haploplasma axanthum]|uniref:Phosphate-specific transport system accessory protein PhoU n=1 Tax=Haploplasma axanthum TaxID=29552 RepID=A0A449BFX0_HAPAX|nr:phosphate signaling complex protein PhoU [Haploplasma axanthum]VEU81305.1 Phosphate transport system protein PhoU [Haploplasma axanthum]